MNICYIAFRNIIFHYFFIYWLTFLSKNTNATKRVENSITMVKDLYSVKQLSKSRNLNYKYLLFIKTTYFI